MRPHGKLRFKKEVLNYEPWPPFNKLRVRGRHGDYIICGGAQYLWILSMELHVTLRAPRILTWFLDFREICATLVLTVCSLKFIKVFVGFKNIFRTPYKITFLQGRRSRLMLFQEVIALFLGTTRNPWTMAKIQSFGMLGQCQPAGRIGSTAVILLLNPTF
jgi:hypothetical protein